jgi:hypothetical protein
MQGLVITLPSEKREVILFGPPPKTKDDLRFLIKEKGIQCIINVCPFTNERADDGTEKAQKYMGFCAPDEKRPENTLDVRLLRLPFDSSSFEATGRTKELKKIDLAQFYISHVKLIEKTIQKEKVVGNIYIHSTTGITEEAYLAIALWKLRNHSSKMDFLNWIRENNYEWLFDDDNDKKELLTFILNEVCRGHLKTNFFKKVKKDE